MAKAEHRLMSSYYDDPDFADEYRRRDADAEAWAAEEKERDEATRQRRSLTVGDAPGWQDGLYFNVPDYWKTLSVKGATIVTFEQLHAYAQAHDMPNGITQDTKQHDVTNWLGTNQ